VVNIAQSKISSGLWRRLPVLIAVAAIAGGAAGVVPAAGAVAATAGPPAAHVPAQGGDITFQAVNLGDHDEFVITFPEAMARALSHSDSDQPPFWAGSGKPVSMPGNHFIYLSGSGINHGSAGAGIIPLRPCWPWPRRRSWPG
jgi:hypothetical protein